MISPKLILGGAILAVILALSGYGWFEHNRYARVKAEYDGFVAQAQAIAAIQLAENQRKEKENAQRIKDAESDRDIAITKLRHSTANTGRLRSLLNSRAAEGSSRVCYQSDQLDRAYRELVSEIRAIAGEGQAGLIDNKAWFDSWPR